MTKPASEPVSRGEDKLLDDVAAQAGLVLRNVRLIEELRSSRQRLVATQDEERRRLERNLHEGARQSLVSVALLIRTGGPGCQPTLIWSGQRWTRRRSSCGWRSTSSASRLAASIRRS